MKNIFKVLTCQCVLLLSLQSPAHSDFAPTPGKSPVIVVQGEVTIDGQQRPDLGRSFADTIVGGLIKTNVYSVIDHLSNQPLSQAIENNTSLAPEQSAVNIGSATGARWIFVPRMIVEGDFHKLTMKKIRVSDGQVVDVFETYATGDRSTMFVLIGDALKQIYADIARDTPRPKRSTGDATPTGTPDELDPHPVGGSYESPPEPPTPEAAKTIPADDKGIPDYPGAADAAAGDAGAPATTKDTEPEAAAKEKTTKITDPATETENESAQYVGTISAINTEWRFCILKLKSSLPLAIGDRLSVKVDSIVPTGATLQVTKLEGRQAVADLVDDAELEPLKVGQSFYKWLPK